MSNFRRLFACLIFLLVTLATNQDAQAQGARGLPDPISSAGLERLLGGVGVKDPPAAAIDGPMSRYLVAMETLRNGRIEAWLDQRREGPGMFESPDPTLIRNEIEDRRRLLSAIAALDRTLFSELSLAGLDADALERAADRRARDRAHSVIGRRFSRGIRIEPSQVLAGVVADADPAWVVDDATRNRMLDHDRARTERLQRLADLVIDRPLRIAEAMGDVRMPDLETAANDPEGVEAAFNSWFTARRAAKSVASEDARVLQAAILQADTAFHDELTPGLREGDPFAIAIDDAWRKATLPSIFPDRGSPRGLFESANEAEKRGAIGAEAMEEIRALESSWRTRHAEIEARLIRAVTQEIREGEESSSGMRMGTAAISLTMIGPDGEVVDESAPEPTSASGRLLAERATLDRETRTRLESIAPKELARRDAPPTPQQVFLGGDGGAVMAQGMPIMAINVEAGGFDFDDLDGLGLAVEGMIGEMGLGMAGGGERIPRPIEPPAYDLMLGNLGLADTMRSIADALYADYRDAWDDLDEGLVTEWRSIRNPGPMFAGPGDAPDGAARDDVNRAASLRLRILDEANALDATLFRDLEVLIDDRRELEHAERRRRREIAVASIEAGMTPGSDQLANLDLERILAETGDGKIESLGLEYAAEVTPAQFERARATIELDRGMRLAEMEMFAEFERGGDDAGMVFEMNSEPDAMSDLEAFYARRATIEESMRSRQIAWRDRMAAALPPDRAADFLLGVDRAAHPGCFRDPDSPEPMFEKALSLPDLKESKRSAIADLQTRWRTDWIEACRKLVAIDALVQGGMASPGVEIDMSMFAKASADRAQIRFARTELDERAVRSLLAILTPGQAGEVEKARRSAPRIEGIRGLDGLNGIEGLESIEGGAIFIGG